MAIRTKRIKGGNGINYTKEVDGQSDWINILNDTYFKDLSDGLIYWKDLSGLVIAIYEIAGTTGVTGDGDYGNIIFVSEVGPSGDTRNDVIGKIMNPVDINWATSIAQSGDTIHVKAGTYNVTVTGITGLSVDGVNHYFEENAKVYKSTAGGLFVRDPFLGINSGGNVYGNGSFYCSGSAGIIYYFGGFNYAFSGNTTLFSTTSIFEFDECISSSAGCVFGPSGGDVIIKGKTRMITSVGFTISMNIQVVGEKQIIDCPYIESTAASSSAIYTGNGAGGCGDLILNAHSIKASGVSSIGLNIAGSAGRLIANVTYLDSFYCGFSPTNMRNINFTGGRIDKLIASGNIVDINAHVGYLVLNASSVTNIKLCDEFVIIQGIGGEDSITNITMTNITGFTSGVSSCTIFGTLNLEYTKLISTTSTETPGVPQTFGTGPKTYTFIGPYGKINLLGEWDGDDTFSLRNSIHTNISSDAIIKGSTFNFFDVTPGLTTKLEVRGKTSDTQINFSGLTNSVVLNGATMLVSDQDKQIITTPFSGSTVKVYTGGLNTNKFIPFGAEQEKLKVNVLTTSPVITIDGGAGPETFSATTGSISTAAAAVVSAINLSGILGVTATQDNPGADPNFYIEADVAGTPMVVTYDANTSLNVKVRYNNNGATDAVGGTVIEDTEID